MRRLVFLLAFLTSAPLLRAQDAPVRITLKPAGLVHGVLQIPATVRADVARIELSINGIPNAEQRGARSVVFKVPIGNYVRRLRFRVSGYDASGTLVGEDEMVVNDPQPPFRAKLIARDIDPKQKSAEMSAVITAPESVRVAGVDFFYGETKIATDSEPPYNLTFDPSTLPAASYVRITARTAAGDEANDVFFFGTTARESVDVVLQRIPVSIVGPASKPLSAGDLHVIDDGAEVPIEALVSASDEPLSVVLLIDSSQSMMQELPVVRQAAKDFARTLIGGKDVMAVVGFHERTFWLTPFTNDVHAIDAAVENLRPLGRTHLYDATIEMLFELQKRPGRHALVVLTDGANDGGDFNLDQLVHYVRYSGVPLYPVIKNSALSRMMKFGIGYLQVRRVADVASDSGATYFIIEKTQQIAEVYRKIADELNHQSTILFYPRGGNAEEHWHPLKVETSNDVKIRSPKGYFP